MNAFQVLQSKESVSRNLPAKVEMRPKFHPCRCWTCSYSVIAVFG